MDDDTISTFNTVCTAGFACEGFNEQTNDQLRKLADVGLLVVAYAPGLVTRTPAYKPTKTGWEFFKQLLSGKKHANAGPVT